MGARAPLSTGPDETGVKEAFGPAETSTGPGLALRISSRVGSEASLSVGYPVAPARAYIPKLFSKMRSPGKLLNHTKGERSPRTELSFSGKSSDESSEEPLEELLVSLLEVELELLALAPTLLAMEVSVVPLGTLGTGVSTLSWNSVEAYPKKRLLRYMEIL